MSLIFRIFMFLLVSSFIISCRARDENVAVPQSLSTSIDQQASHKEKLLLQDEIIKRQQQEIKKQDRELEDLERQKMFNESLRRFEQQAK